MDVDARIEALEAENERLRDEVARLADRHGVGFLAPVEWRLTVQETRLLGALLARSVASKDALMAALYRNDGRDEPQIKIVGVYVCKLRAKLKPYGIAIETRWGVGYFLSPEAKAQVQAATQGVAA